MRRLGIIIFISIYVTNLNAQEYPFVQFAHSYFRSDPFEGEFSSFLKHLTNDPGIEHKELQRRTDTSLFYFFGVYKNYNPFFFKPKRVEILLQEMPMQYSDSIAVFDTVMVYQLMAYNDASDKSMQEIRKEFDKIHRQYNRKFSKSNSVDLKDGDIINGGVHNYFEMFYGLAPVSIAWKKLAETNETVLNLTIRMKSSYNQAVLAAPFYQPK